MPWMLRVYTPVVVSGRRAVVRQRCRVPLCARGCRCVGRAALTFRSGFRRLAAAASRDRLSTWAGLPRCHRRAWFRLRRGALVERSRTAQRVVVRSAGQACASTGSDHARRRRPRRRAASSEARERSAAGSLEGTAPRALARGVGAWRTHWEWTLHSRSASAPALRDRRRENDRSCVIRVVAGAGSALLAADIERQAEGELLARSRDRLRSDVLLVPHHGSRSSSTPAFVDAVSPSVALVSVGWRNRFRQPSPLVEARYRESGASLLRTDVDGAIRVELPARAGGMVAVRSHAARRRYWSDRSPGPP